MNFEFSMDDRIFNVSNIKSLKIHSKLEIQNSLLSLPKSDFNRPESFGQIVKLLDMSDSAKNLRNVIKNPPRIQDSVADK